MDTADTAESHLAAAESALREGHVRSALEEIRLTLRTQPENARAIALTALSYSLMGEEPDARAALARAVELAPLDARVRYYCYLSLVRLGDLEGARTQLTYFSQLEPGNTQAKALLARMGGAVTGLPPLPRPKTAVWYDGGGHALTTASDFEENTTDDAEPPPGPEVVVCPECEKRTWKGWVCSHCGATLPRA